MEKEVFDKKSLIRTSGALIAWVIGSGFATGQEILQFFSSYGYFSFGIIVINFIGFLILGYLLMRTGFENRDIKNFNHFKYFCGNKLGTSYTFLITGTLILLMPVLVSGAGATLYEYYGLNKYIGSAIMAILMLIAYLIGFERLVRIIAPIGPIIIVFSILVGIITLISDFDYFNDIPTYGETLLPYQSAPSWFLSAFLYLGLNFFPGSTYFTQIGVTAKSKEDLKYGTLLGVVLLMLSITIMSTAILLNGDTIAGLDIPVLYLARKISYILGAIFSITLILGIFSSCSAMMWSVCSRFHFGGRRGNALIAIGIAMMTFIISMFSFSELVGVLYPIVGYVGLFFIGCVLYKGLSIKRKLRT
ncbi:hypothetical protein [Leptolyngbya sp. 7M]|uniref:YkvI family membrane protein n=1 Tax=Leptolyngbya sp. 7M TaxID=2812896 RepID=UPI001B8A9A17|nr:hypothetical protein [Leptolyngbya sp. 7M]QYO63129.1 hypothetical protein JVX88_24670 [Leptolyngbya sp. 7M]